MKKGKLSPISWAILIYWQFCDYFEELVQKLKDLWNKEKEEWGEWF